jgi:SAM-dependent methyltransferase
MVAGGRDTQAEVIGAYDRYVMKADPRDQVAYMASKFQVDYRLVGMTDVRGKRVLNVGCSFPVDELYFAHKVREWVGVDLSRESVRLAATVVEHELHPELARRIHHEVQDATRLEFEDASFDVALSFSTFDHIPSSEGRQQAINELARVTRPGGCVIVTVPNRRHALYYARSRYQQRRQISLYGYEYCFAPEELRAMLVTAGLRPETFVSTFSYRQFDLSMSPAWQRPFIRAGLALPRALSYFGHRMGYLSKR